MNEPTEIKRVTFAELFKLIVSDHKPENKIVLHYITMVQTGDFTPEDPTYRLDIVEFDTASGESIKEFIEQAAENEGGFMVYLNADVRTGYQIVDEETRQPL